MRYSLFEILLILGLITAIAVTLFCNGCSTTKCTFPDGTEFLHQPLWFESTAKKVDFYYESIDPNGIGYAFWLIVDDPNRSVNPGRLKLTEPKTGINATLKAE